MFNTITTYRTRFPGEELVHLVSLKKDLHPKLTPPQVNRLLDFAYLYLKWDIRRTNEAADFKRECFPERPSPISMQFPTNDVIALSKSKMNPDISDPILFFMHNSLYRASEDEARNLFISFEKNIRGRLEHLDGNKRSVQVSDSLQRRINKCLLNLLKNKDSLTEEDKARYLMELDRLLVAINENLPNSIYGLEILQEDLNKPSPFCEKVAYNSFGLINVDKPERFWESPQIPVQFLTAARKISHSRL